MLFHVTELIGTGVTVYSVAVKLFRGDTISPKIVSLGDTISRDISSLYEIVLLYSLCEQHSKFS